MLHERNQHRSNSQDSALDTPSQCINTRRTSRPNDVSNVMPKARQIRITNKFIGQLKSIPRLNHTAHLNTARRLYSFRDCAKQLGCTEVTCRQSNHKTAIPYRASLLLQRINLLAMEPRDADCKAKKFFQKKFSRVRFSCPLNRFNDKSEHSMKSHSCRLPPRTTTAR